MMRPAAWFAVKEASAVAEARRCVKGMAQDIGLGEEDGERAAIVTTEAATNMVRHAGGGRLLACATAHAGPPALTLVAADRGEGITNVDKMMVDGVSTKGSAGIGLGAMMRQADALDIRTSVGGGTVVTAQVRPRTDRPATGALETAVLWSNYPGETVCGDGWAIRERAAATDLLLCDGLGHGLEAHRAATAVVGAVSDTLGTPQHAIRGLSRAAEGTRGAVALLVSVGHEDDTLTYNGLGNISGMVVSRRHMKRFALRDGRLGSAREPGADETVPFATDDLLILHSDGLRMLRDIAERSDLLFRSPLAIAAGLIDGYERGSDDACVIVARRTDASRDRAGQ